MEPWIEISDRLRERYVVGAAYALDRLAGLLERLAAFPSRRQSRELLVELRRLFHGLAGSGGSYGFPGISAAAAAGERPCAAMLDGRALPAAADLERWRGLVREMATELAGAPRTDSSPTSSAGAPQTSSCEISSAGAPQTSSCEISSQGAGTSYGSQYAGTSYGSEAPARILYMEDSALQAAYTRSVLEAAGYQVRCCADPGRFGAELDAFRPALVLMDILLPGTTGYDLVRRLRTDERLATLPVLFLTTEDQVQARIETVRSGGDDHLVKPVAPKLLLSAVAVRLERSRRLTDLLTRDGLTRLLTRAALLDRARQLVERERLDPGHRLTWVMIDLDRFKSINDRFGHPVGDRVLAAAADHLSRNLRGGDFVGRCGGEEFALLLDGPAESEARSLVERLRTDFGCLRHEAGDGISFGATFSAGIALLRPGMDVEQWRSAADFALYAAKAAGRNRVEMAAPAPAWRGKVVAAAAVAAAPPPAPAAEPAPRAPW